MRLFTCCPSGEKVDLDDPKTYDYLPDDVRELDDKMLKEIGYALAYMDYMRPEFFTEKDEIGWGQRERVNKLVKEYCDERISRTVAKDDMWLKERIFLFQDETENMC